MASIIYQYRDDPASGSIPREISRTTHKLILALLERDAFGKAKYGTTLDRTDLSKLDWAQHLQEELMDAVGYIECLKREITKDVK